MSFNTIDDLNAAINADNTVTTPVTIDIGGDFSLNGTAVAVTDFANTVSDLVADGTRTVTAGGNAEQITLVSTVATGVSVGTGGVGGTLVTGLPVSYLRGTRILTSQGEIAVEELQPGMLLAARFGWFRPVKWIGVQSFNGRFLGRSKAPVCFRAGSLGPDIPHRDLTVSPGHSILFGERLVCAELLVNDVTITQQAGRELVEYFHIDLGAHDCVLADGAWAESYAEHRDRAMFHNHLEFTAAFPDHVPTWQALCLPRIERSDDPALVAIRGELATPVADRSFTAESDVHLLADGRRIDPISVEDKRWIFAVPAETWSLRLRSNATRPSTSGTSTDHRLLGFLISQITAETDGETISLLADDADLGEGFHRVEQDGAGKSWRWTDGDALLPATLLGDGASATMLTITGRGLRQYIVHALSQAA
jgi:hypothetical protein